MGGRPVNGVGVGGKVGEGGIEPPKCLVSFMCVVRDWRLVKLSLHQTHLKMSLLLSGPLLSHWDCHALGLDPLAANLEAAAAAALKAAAEDTAGLFPLAISLILSRGFPLVEVVGEADETGNPIWSLCKASGVIEPAAKSGCRKGQELKRLASSPSFGIFASFLLPDKSKGDSVSLEGEEAGLLPPERLRTPAKEAACEGEASSLSSCLRFLT